jgi:hypothetical protein
MFVLRSTARILVALVVLLGPSLATAVPMTYVLQSGTVTITVSAGATLLLPATSVPLDLGNYVQVDEAVPSITDLLFSITSAGPFLLSSPYAGYDTVTIDSATLTPGTGFSGNITLQLAGPPFNNYSYSVGPLNLVPTISALNSSGPPPAPLVSNTFPPIPGTNLSGVLFVNATSMNFALIGIVLGILPAPVNSGLPDLIIKGDFFFQGGAVPEPGTALMLGVGLLGLLAMSRRLTGSR